MTDLALILAAILLAATGGEAFLKSILGAALHLRMPKMVVATTLAAFATSSPELTVSSVAALAGQPEIGLGNALGSTVVNIALIFGLALLYGSVQTTRAGFGRDFYLALGIPLVTLFFALDGRIERGEAFALLATFAFGWHQPYVAPCATGMRLSPSRPVNCRRAGALSSAYWASAP